MENTLYHPVPQPDDISLREREDAMGGYLMMFAALAAGLPLPIINLIAAIIYYYVNNKKSRFIKFHALQSLLSQIPTTVLNAGLVFWTVRIIFYGKDEMMNILDVEENQMYWGYFLVTALANIMYVIFSLIAAFRARKGRFYYFLFFGKLAFHYAYVVCDEEEKKEINKAPKF